MDKKYKTVDEAISALKAEAQKRQDKQDEDYKKIFTFTGKSSKKFSSSDLKTIRKYDKDNYKANNLRFAAALPTIYLPGDDGYPETDDDEDDD